MNRLTILPLGKILEVKPGTTILDALRQSGIEISSPCNGKHLCGKCKIKVVDPDAAHDVFHEKLTAAELAAGMRLACEVAVEKDMRISLPENYSRDTRILEGERIRRSRVAPAATIDGQGSTWRLHYRQRPVKILDNWHKDDSPKGIALDLGTTTLVATLMDLQSGTELATASAVNPQHRFGHDVMTRIHKASTRKGLSELHGLISDAIDALSRETCQASGSQPHEIVDGVIGGNTTMLQIAAGIDPSPLGVLPFTVGIDGGRSYPVDRFGWCWHPQARVYIPPVAHAFVGSDISAGLLSIDFFNQVAPLLFIDMGTNGEMALFVDGNATVTSTAAGPAFEGMGITHGMRAAAGAIETVWANDEYLNLRTIEDEPARGICGSGLMEIMALLIRYQAVEPGGRLVAAQTDPARRSPFPDRYEKIDGTAAIRLSENVTFTQKDVRQFQLAKSAIQTGIDMLLAGAGVHPRQLKKIVIAGAFGYHLREESLRHTGIIPKEFSGSVEFAGNTCRTGCALMLTDATRRDYLEDRMTGVRHMAIAESADFQSRFIDNLELKY